MSGSDSALLYDTTISLKKEKQYEKILGNIKLREYILFAITSIIGAYIFTIHANLPLIGTIITAAISLLLFSLAKEPQLHKKKVAKPIKFSVVFSRKRVWWLIAYSAGIVGLGFTIHRAFMQVYVEPLVPIATLGFLFAGYRVLQGTGAAFAHKLRKHIGYAAAIITGVSIQFAFMLVGILIIVEAVILLTAFRLIFRNTAELQG